MKSAATFLPAPPCGSADNSASVEITPDAAFYSAKGPHPCRPVGGFSSHQPLAISPGNAVGGGLLANGCRQ